jgi:hypothetical protein
VVPTRHPTRSICDPPVTPKSAPALALEDRYHLAFTREASNELRGLTASSSYAIESLSTIGSVS